MKIVIELEDAYIRRLVSEQIGKSISELSREVLEQRVKEVLFNMSENLETKVNGRTEPLLRELLTKNLNVVFKDLAENVMRDLLKEKFK